MRRLAECLRLIPLDAQIVLELRFFEGATARRIAELTEIPRGSVERRVQQGVSQLRELLQRDSASARPPRAEPTPEEFERWMSEIRSVLPG